MSSLLRVTLSQSVRLTSRSAGRKAAVKRCGEEQGENEIGCRRFGHNRYLRAAAAGRVAKSLAPLGVVGGGVGADRGDFVGERIRPVAPDDVVGYVDCAVVVVV